MSIFKQLPTKSSMLLPKNELTIAVPNYVQLTTQQGENEEGNSDAVLRQLRTKYFYTVRSTSISADILSTFPSTEPTSNSTETVTATTREKFELMIPKIPTGAFDKIIDVFRYFTMQFNSEAVAVIYYIEDKTLLNKEKLEELLLSHISSFEHKIVQRNIEHRCEFYGNYLLYFPTQKIDSVSVEFSQDIMYQKLSFTEEFSSVVKILEIHSHHTMRAFFSNTDVTNQNEDCIYGVVGELAYDKPSIRLAYSKQEIENYTDVFENNSTNRVKGSGEKTRVISLYKGEVSLPEPFVEGFILANPFTIEKRNRTIENLYSLHTLPDKEFITSERNLSSQLRVLSYGNLLEHTLKTNFEGLSHTLVDPKQDDEGMVCTSHSHTIRTYKSNLVRNLYFHANGSRKHRLYLVYPILQAMLLEGGLNVKEQIEENADNKYMEYRRNYTVNVGNKQSIFATSFNVVFLTENTIFQMSEFKNASEENYTKSILAYFDLSKQHEDTSESKKMKNAYRKLFKKIGTQGDCTEYEISEFLSNYMELVTEVAVGIDIKLHEYAISHSPTDEGELACDKFLAEYKRLDISSALGQNIAFVDKLNFYR